MSHGAPINTAVPPRLSVQTASPQTAVSGPSSSSNSGSAIGSGTGSLGRRPMGARRRGVAAGLYVANPDNSDDDGISPVRTSPVTASSTSSGGDQPRGLPTIPQGNTPPPPGVHSTSTPNLLAPNATPPLPPPQPDRHLARRAFTSPVPPQQLDQQAQSQQQQQQQQHGGRPMEHRHGSLGGGGGGSHLGHTHTQQPSASPSRGTRPALPSPPTQSSPPPQHSGGSSGHDGRPLPPNPQRMSSPEEVLSPVVEAGRARAGSFNNTTKRRLQVTTDNEQFTLVDITGMNTAEAIRDRIFSKLRFRDDEYPNLSLQRTEYGEDPDPRTVSHDELCQLCYSLSDHKANLKFLVVQGVPSSSAAVVPPVDTANRDFVESATATATAQRHSHASSSVGSSSFVHTPPQPSYTSLPTSAGGSGNGSGSFPAAQAGPSRRTSVLGLDVQSGSDGMDQATRDLIAQLQREDEEEAMREEARRRQLQADEELARKEQQSEAQEWHALQEEQEIRARQQRDQIIRDEHRAREIAAEERRIDQESTYRPGDRSQEGTYRGSQDGGTYRSDRRNTYEREQEFANDRRNRREQWSQTGRMARGGEEHQYPSVNPIFSGNAPAPPAFPSPPTTYTQDAYQQDAFQQEPSYSAPTGFHRGYSESAHAQGRLTDHQLQEVQGRRNTAGGPGPSQTRRPVHPYAYTAQEAPGARSVENLAGHGRPAYSNALPAARGSLTPQPSDVRTFPPQAAMYRSPSAEHAQDGRYPDPARTSSIPFPSPQPRGSGVYDSPPQTSSGIRRSGSRPSSLHDETGSSGSGLPRRPNTLHDHSPPHIEGYQWQPRSASTASSSSSANYATGSPTSSSGPERLPYERAHTDSWLAVPGRHDSSDTASSSGMSEATVNPGDRRSSIEDENSNDTAKPRDWQAVMGDLIASAKGPAAAGAGDDDEEATLFLPSSSSAPTTLRRGGAGSARSPPPKPLLTVDTRTNSPGQPTTDSATDSEGETAGGGRVQRGKSFARPDPGQWHTRPDPAQLYDRLDKYFPKVDLDQPIVEGGNGNGGGSTPSTPGETPTTAVANLHGGGGGNGMPPPPVHPTRAPAASASGYDGTHLSPRTESIPRAPPTHPARSAFNKAENRKSIRVVADYKRKTLARNEPKEPSSSSSASQGKDEMKLSRRMSMWGHRVVEVTASKLNLGQLPLPTTPGSPAEPGADDSKEPQTLNWVKGELIGKGSYGRVYIALNISTGDMMAVKQVELPATERDRNDRKQLGQIESLRQEIALLKDMYHPNIVAYLGFETSPEYLSIFLEYVPGGTIATIYRTPNQARFEAELVKYFTRQILEGLAYLHQKHIWHRDLKGDNILVDLNGICKISDFGISKQTADAYDSFGQATNMKGSVFWMAPEVLHTVQNDRSYSGKVDIWSLGCVVIEMWSGKRPWGELEQIPAMMQLFKRMRPPVPDDVHLDDAALDFLNTKCLALDPKDRPTAVELLQHKFITKVDPKWTFKDSKIGRNVANTAPRTMSTTGTTTTGGTGTGGGGGTATIRPGYI